MQVNHPPTYYEAKIITDNVTKNIFLNYKNTPHREISYQEAEEDVEYMVKINQLIEEMIKRRNSRILPNN